MIRTVLIVPIRAAESSDATKDPHIDFPVVHENTVHQLLLYEHMREKWHYLDTVLGKCLEKGQLILNNF